MERGGPKEEGQSMRFAALLLALNTLLPGCAERTETQIQGETKRTLLFGEFQKACEERGKVETDSRALALGGRASYTENATMSARISETDAALLAKAGIRRLIEREFGLDEREWTCGPDQEGDGTWQATEN